MAGKGPARTPTAILKARGSQRGKQRAKCEPTAPDGIPVCPASMSRDEKVVWRMLIARLDSLGVSSKADSLLLRRYCEAIIERKSLRAQVAAEGHTYPCGLQQKQHPALARIGKLEDQLLRYDQEFGLSPASRARLSVAPAKAKDDLADFVAGKPDLKVVGAE